MMVELDALCVGEPLVQLHPVDGDLEHAAGFAAGVGGAECNVAVSMAALGRRVGFASRVGPDPFGRRLLASLADAGVDTSLVTVGHEPTGVYFKSPSADGSAAHYYRAGSAATRMRADDATAWAAIVRPRLVHVSGITAMISDGAAALARAIVVDRVFGPAVVSFDVNMRRALATAQTPALLLELACASDLVFVGRDEAAALWGTDTADDVASLASGPRSLVVKDSDREAVEFGGEGRIAVPAPAVDIVEPTGAGDAFAAAWLDAWLAGAEPADRLAAGHRLAGEALRSSGDVPRRRGVPA